MSESSDMRVSYHVCFDGPQRSPSCADPVTVLIKHKKSDADQNYIVVTSPFPPLQTPGFIFIHVISAIEQDRDGHTQSKGIFSSDEDGDTCGGVFNGLYYNHLIVKRNQGIILNDMHQSPYILCIANPSALLFDEPEPA